MEDTTNKQTSPFGLVLITAGSETEATTLANHLVQAKLAACVSITPIQSVYTWKGEVQHDQEWQLVIKTDLSHFEDISQAVAQLHSYEVPEIIAVPIHQGLPSYMQWMAEQTKA